MPSPTREHRKRAPERFSRGQVARGQLGGAPDAVQRLLTLQRDAGNRAVADVLANLKPLPQPRIDAGNGTTEQLQAELERLKSEKAKLEERRRQDPAVKRREEGVGGAAPYFDEYQMTLAHYDHLIAKLESRIAERGNSTKPDCTLELTFDGENLEITGDKSDTFPAVSGKPDSSGNFDYSPARQRMENEGAIPQGEYWIAPQQLKDLWYYKLSPIGDPAGAWGTHRITIHPFDGTHTFGRGGFFIHGGSTPGSIGCIDLTSHMADFAKLIAPYGGCKIKLNVDYTAINSKQPLVPAGR